ncbi:MAG: hypothetical protein DLM68_18655 [Hyphomicrobiales bacterium]|nr:MAG: hypothetical protein DLM68_18655 [Hyphomicrobiales bacterium]
MNDDKELIALINLIYEAVLKSDLWPSVLVKLADALGVAQVAMPSMDRRANVVSTIAPRFDPDLLASWHEYWAFHDPVLARATLRPAGEIYTLDSLMPREEFAATLFLTSCGGQPSGVLRQRAPVWWPQIRPRRRTQSAARASLPASPCDGNAGSVRDAPRQCSLDRRRHSRRHCHGDRPRERPAAAGG